MKSLESFLRKVSICTLSDLNTGFGRPWNNASKEVFWPKNVWISCTGSRGAILSIFPFSQNGTFETVHEIQIFGGPKVIFSESLRKMARRFFLWHVSRSPKSRIYAGKGTKRGFSKKALVRIFFCCCCCFRCIWIPQILT